MTEKVDATVVHDEMTEVTTLSKPTYPNYLVSLANKRRNMPLKPRSSLAMRPIQRL